MRSGQSGLWRNAALQQGYAGGHTDDLPHPEYVQWQRNCLAAMLRLLKDDGAIFYNHKWRVQGGLFQGRQDIVAEFPVRQIIIWDRGSGFNHNLGYYVPTYEVIYLICKPGFRLASHDLQNPKAACRYGDVWRINPARHNPHPAPFPVEIPRRCIETTQPQIVLDPFLGSGSTAMAAKLQGADWIGIERSEEYCRMAEERLASWEPGSNVEYSHKPRKSPAC